MVYDDKRTRIISALDINDVVTRYTGLEQNRHNRYPCPLHSGDNKNFTVYPRTKSFCCFVCGAGGDLIKFVSLYLGLSYSEAMKKLDNDYMLNVFEKQHKTYNSIAKSLTKANQKQKEKDKYLDYQAFSYELLIRYFKWLNKRPRNKAINHDIEYIERLLDKHLDYKENPIQLNVKALILALYSKHREVIDNGKSKNSG